jgi:hypothetical protein
MGLREEGTQFEMQDIPWWRKHGPRQRVHRSLCRGTSDACGLQPKAGTTPCQFDIAE